MSCFNPMVAMLPPVGSGLKPKFLRASEHTWKNKVNTPKPLNTAFLSCKQCLGCRLDYSKEWAIRISHEASLYDFNSFATLTYNEEHLPADASLVVRDMQLFFKRLRKAYPHLKIRYYYCGEYGGKTNRPHYHAIIFNFYPEDATYWKSVNGYKYFTSKSLEKIWGLGFVTVGDVSPESAAYVARYSTKKVNGSRADEHYMRWHSDTGEIYHVKPEFSQASRGSGIGTDFYRRYATDFYPSDEVIIKGKRCRPPKFYDKLLKKDNPVLYERVRARRQEYFDKKEPEDMLFKFLVARKKHTEQRFKRLVRSMEAQA